MADKSRADLEYELECALNAKLAAEDRLSADRLTPLTEQLDKAQATYAELEQQHWNARTAKEDLQGLFESAVGAEDDVDVMNEELLENDTLIASIREEIDNNTAEINTLRERIATIKTEFDVHLEELEMAKLNNEHTGLLERRLQIMESEFNEIVEELHILEDVSTSMDMRLQEACDARESAEHILDDVDGRCQSAVSLEAQISELDGVIEDTRSTLEAHWDLIAEMKEDIERISDETKADEAIVAEQTATLEALNEELASIKDPIAERNEDLDSLLAKLSEATCHEDLYALGSDFNKLGFTIATTSGGRAVLCRVNEGKIVADKVLEDFVFIGDPGNIFEHFTDGTVDKIADFVKDKAGASCQCESKEPVAVINEDKQLAVDIAAEAGPRA